MNGVKGEEEGLRRPPSGAGGGPRFAGLLEEARSGPAGAGSGDPTESVVVLGAARAPSGPSPAPEASPADGADLDVGRRPTRVVSPLPEDAGDAPTSVAGYRLLERIGEGGMAVVHRAHQPSLDRSVAVKSLRPALWGDAEVESRFEREAAVLARIHHEGVVSVLDLVTDARGGRHIVMELVEGVDLFDLLDRGGPLPVDPALVVGQRLAAALDRAHDHGIFHRDIKPANVRLSRRGEVKLMDFGVARDDAAMELTLVGFSVGTPEYMAPEQIQGQAVDGKTDVFGLGVLLFEVLTGAPPWSGAGAGKSVALDVLREPAPDLAARRPEVPRALARLVARCLQKTASDRPSMAAVEAELATLAHARGLTRSAPAIVDLLASRGLAPPRRAEPVPPVVPAPVPGGIAPLLIAHGVGLAALLAAGLLTAYWPLGRPLPPPRVQTSIEAPPPPASPEASNPRPRDPRSRTSSK